MKEEHNRVAVIAPGQYATEEIMKLTTIALATVLTLPATFVMAQGGTGGAGNAAAAASGSSTTTGTGGGSMNNGTTANEMGSGKMPSAGASDQGAPTAAAPNSQGTATEPGAVQEGKSR
jgi:hypothetical protein